MRKNNQNEEWREFWNSIGGSEVDPSSLRRQPNKITQQYGITQQQLGRYFRLYEGLKHGLEMYKHLKPEFKTAADEERVGTYCRDCYLIPTKLFAMNFCWRCDPTRR